MAEFNSKIALVGAFSQALEPLAIQLTQIGYQLQSLVNSDDLKRPAEKNSSGISPNISLGIYPVAEPFDFETAQRHFRELTKKYPFLRILAVYSGRLKVSINMVFRLGVEGVFQFPFDEEVFINKLFEISPIEQDVKTLSLDSLVRVNVIDLDKKAAIPFDIFLYLPANAKTIKYRAGGTTMDEKTVEKFKKQKNYSLYIKKSDLSSYQKYCGDQLFADSKTMQDEKSKQERAEKLSEFMGGFFANETYSKEDAQNILNNLKGALKSQKSNNSTNVQGNTQDALQNGVQGSIPNSLQDSVEQLAQNKMTNYSHAQNVAAYCALFGPIVGLNNLDDLQLGGFLHDMGMAELPLELMNKSEFQMSDEEKSQFKLHPGFAKQSLKEKGLTVSETVMAMILYHHEHSDGSGFPYGFTKEKIPAPAKICALADVLDELTSVRKGFRPLTPQQAILQISGRDGTAAHPIYDPEFHGPIVDVFLKNADLPSPEDLGKVHVVEAGKSLTCTRQTPTILLQDLPQAPQAPLPQGPALLRIRGELRDHFGGGK